MTKTLNGCCLRVSFKVDRSSNLQHVWNPPLHLLVDLLVFGSCAVPRISKTCCVHWLSTSCIANVTIPSVWTWCCHVIYPSPLTITYRLYDYMFLKDSKRFSITKWGYPENSLSTSFPPIPWILRKPPNHPFSSWQPMWIPS